MAHQNFDSSEFVSVRYYLGTYGCTGSTQRVSYYGSSGTPNLWFNGGHHIVGAGADSATGVGYMGIIRSHYFDAAPIRIDVDSFDPVSGAVSVTVTMYSETYELASENFHIVLFEDDVNTAPATYDDTHLARDVFSDTITLSDAGFTSVFNHTFTIDPSWDTTKLRVVAFVQLQDKTIIQVGSGDPMPDYKLRAMVPFSRTVIGPSTGSHDSDFLTVMNTGTGGDFEVSVVVDDAPAGWTVAFKDSLGVLHTDPLLVHLATDESTTFKAVAVPASPGFMRYHLVLNSPSLTRPLEIPFVYITNDVDLLIVDDDGGDTYENYFREALDTAGRSYGVWDTSSDPLTQDVADTFDVLVWNVGFSSPTLDDADKAFLSGFLDNGKALFLSGQDIGWDLNSSNPDPVWYQSYLHATYIRDNTAIMTLNGVSGDPVTNGLDLYIDGGTGASNQDYPDEIAAADADATEILYYQGDGCGAVRSLDSVTGARVVYLGFGFEGIDNATDRFDLLNKAITWIGPEIFSNGFDSTDTSAWSNSVP